MSKPFIAKNGVLVRNGTVELPSGYVPNSDLQVSTKAYTDAKMTNPMTASGDIVIGGTSGAPTRLAKGSDGQVLTLASGSPAWQSGSAKDVQKSFLVSNLSTTNAIACSVTLSANKTYLVTLQFFHNARIDVCMIVKSGSNILSGSYVVASENILSFNGAAIAKNTTTSFYINSMTQAGAVIGTFVISVGASSESISIRNAPDAGTMQAGAWIVAQEI